MQSAVTYLQRKALRRLERGQSISRSMQHDSLIKKCYEEPIYNIPKKTANIVEWCDWESASRSRIPVINTFGKEILKELQEK